MAIETKDKLVTLEVLKVVNDNLKEDLNDLKEQGISGGSASVTGLKSILTDMVTFMKSVPFDDSTASATDLDSIQNKIDKLSESETPPSGGDEEPDEPNPPIEEPDEPTEPEWVDVESQMFSYNYITAYTDDGNTIDESYNPSGGQTCRITTEPFEKDGVVELAITKVESVVILDLRSGLVRNPTMANSQYFDVWYSKKINHMDFGSTRNDRFTLETNGSVQIPVKAGYHFVLFIKNSQNVFPDTYTWSLKYKEGA